MDKKTRRLLSEVEARSSQRAKLTPEACLFGPQLAMAQDTAKMIVACCSRRAGKSFELAFKFSVAAMRYPGCVIPYVTLTREDAKNIIHPAFRDLDAKFGLGLRFRENNGDVVFPNGSKVILRGAGTAREIEKLRGPKYPIVAVDEAQVFGEILNVLLDEVLEPATLDYNGQILVTGTPGAACAGPFHDMVKEPGKGWSVHSWTWKDNPHLPDNVEQQIAAMRLRRGWTEQHPGYLREYCGVWVRDTDGLVYEYSGARNCLPGVFDRESAPDWEYVLGIDLGFNDPTAFSVLAYSQAQEKCQVIESYKEVGLIPSAVAAQVEELTQKYPLSKIVADTGGFGKGYAEEMKEKWHLPITPAQKLNKATYIEMLNGDLRSGVVGVYKDANKDLLTELSLLQWDSGFLAKNAAREDSHFANHLCDATLYAWRECRHHGAAWEENAPKPGTPSYWQAVEESIWKQELEDAERPAAVWWEGRTSSDEDI